MARCADKEVDYGDQRKMKRNEDELPRRFRTSKIAKDGAQLIRGSDVILLADERASDVE